MDIKTSNILQDKKFLTENMMGPNSVVILNELLSLVSLPINGNILDLGCGKGLTSIALSQHSQAKIYALDLWIEAKENQQRFKNLNLDNKITSMQADILDKPFEENLFDAIVSIDSYHYFGNKENILDEYIAPLVKKDGIIALAFPGLKKDIHDNIPEALLNYWSKEDFECFHDITWWKNLFSKSQYTTLLDIQEMNCFDVAWDDWLSSNNPYAIDDQKAMNCGGREIMNLISVILKKK